MYNLCLTDICLVIITVERLNIQISYSIIGRAWIDGNSFKVQKQKNEN